VNQENTAMTADSTNTPAVSSINPQMHEGELRILDTELAVRLGFERPRKIRDLIKRWQAEISRLGVCPTVEQTPGPQGGRPTAAYYLNRKQAIFITGKSDTPEATTITIEIIEKFDAYEHGAAPAAHPAVPTSFREALLLAAEQQERIELQQKALAVAAPKAAAHDALSELPGELGVRDAGRELKLGQFWVTKTIIDRGWACRQGGKLRPAHYGLDKGYVRLVPSPYECRITGETKVRDDLRLTRKGIGRLAELIAKTKEVAATRPLSRTRARQAEAVS